VAGRSNSRATVSNGGQLSIVVVAVVVVCQWAAVVDDNWLFVGPFGDAHLHIRADECGHNCVTFSLSLCLCRLVALRELSAGLKTVLDTGGGVVHSALGSELH